MFLAPLLKHNLFKTLYMNRLNQLIEIVDNVAITTGAKVCYNNNVKAVFLFNQSLLWQVKSH